MKVLILRITLACFFVCLLSKGASGAGFDCSVMSASSFSQGHAVIAHSDDASVIFYNPALMNKLDQSQLMLSNIIIIPSSEFRSDATNKKYEMEDVTHYLPRLFAIYKINDTMTAGLGIFNNFGLSTEWDDNWEGRYIATESTLKTTTFNPSLSVKVHPNVYIAGGLDILTLDTDLRKHINLSYFQLPDIKQKMTGDDVGVGYNLGLLVDLTEDLSFGASYRSEIKVGVDGKVKHRIPDDVPLEIASMFPNTNASADVTLPPQAFIGIAYKGLKPFVFEIAGRWNGWSTYDELRVKLNKPIAGSNQNVTPKKWADSYAVSFGTQYRASDMLTLNAGYIYDETPIPDETLEPAIPDNDAHIVCLGADITYKNITIGLMYAYKYLEDRDKDNAVDDNPNDGVVNPLTSANGKYESNAHFAAIDITYRF